MNKRLLQNDFLNELQVNMMSSLYLSPHATPKATNSTTLDNPAALKTALGDRRNWQTLVQKLQTIIQDLTTKFPYDDTLSRAEVRIPMERALASHLNNTPMDVDADSTYHQRQNLTSINPVSLESFINGSGLSVPKTLEELIDLKKAKADQALAHPLGNFAGGLSWPIPIAQQHQGNIISLMISSTTGLPDLPLTDESKGALGYLLSGSSVFQADLQELAKTMEKLLGSPKAQALGQAIQTKLDGFPSDSSVNDYVLTAIHLGLDPESHNRPTPNTVAGFDLAQSQHWGKPASVVIDSLSSHLFEKGRATSQTANLAARLLLARTAPQFLVKDIPASVPYGSVMWAQLSIAATRIEADTPGRVLNMSYAEVLAFAEDMSANELVTEHAQRESLRDWGIANGLLELGEVAPTDIEMERVRTAYNSQLSSMTTTSKLLQTEIPSRKEMALAKLKEAFANVEESVFEASNIQKIHLKPGRPGLYPGMYSALDIVMEGEKLETYDHWRSNDRRITSDTFCNLYVADKLNVANTFRTEYEKAIKAHEDGHQGLVKHLISNLPLEARRDFEYGNLEFFHTNKYKVAMDFTSPLALETRGHTLHVKTTLGSEINVYEVDTRTGTIEKKNFLTLTYTPPYTPKKLEHRNANIVSKTVLFDPFKDEQPNQAKEKPFTSAIPESFNSSRTEYIAKVFVKSLDLHNDDLLNQARGVTSYDQGRALNEAIGEFFLNLIPLRSAIVNFQKGNIGEGLFDLGLDVIGLLTLGAGKAVQAGKVFTKGITSISRLSKVARFVGATAIEAFNPLSGLGDLAASGGRLVINGGRLVSSKIGQQINKFRGATGSYDLLKAASKEYGVAATGTFKVAGHRVKGGAVLQNGKWYAFDADHMQPYGPPLKHFSPDIAAVGDEVRALADGHFINGKATPDVLDYEIKNISINAMGVKGVQANIYVGANNAEYVKMDGKLYKSILKDGERYVQHPTGNGPDFSVRDLGASGWEPRLGSNRLLGGAPPPSSLKLKTVNQTLTIPMDDVNAKNTTYTIKLKDEDHIVNFDQKAGAWKSERPVFISADPYGSWDYVYFWRTQPGQWQLGTLEQFKNTKKIDPHTLTSVDAPLPLDDVNVITDTSTTYTIKYKDKDHRVQYDINARAWRSHQSNVERAGVYFWRAQPGQWESGNISQLITAKKITPKTFASVDIQLPALLRISKNTKPLPKDIHYFWAGRELPSSLQANIARNAANSPGYKSIIHVDADNPSVLQNIKRNLEETAPGIEVKDLHEDDFFKELQSADIYPYFRQGQGKNLAAASDVARYPLMEKYGGIYLDTDDMIVRPIGNTTLYSGPYDILLNDPVGDILNNYKPSYNTSNFATQPDNPIIKEIIREMNARFPLNKTYFEAHRPIASKDAAGDVIYTQEFLEYERKIFETVGPSMFGDVLKSKRPDMYNLGFDGSPAKINIIDELPQPEGPYWDLIDDIVGRYAAAEIVAPNNLLQQFSNAMKHYLPFSDSSGIFEVKIGAEHSWIDS